MTYRKTQTHTQIVRKQNFINLLKIKTIVTVIQLYIYIYIEREYYKDEN